MWTIILGLCVISLAALINNGTEDLGVAFSLELVFYFVVGGIISASIALVAFAVWLVPSAMVFSAVYRGVARRGSIRMATLIAATLTALVASIAFWVITTLLARDFGSIFAFGAILFGPISLLVAPVIADNIYRNGPTAVTQ